jgi:hypothetical protein
MKWLISVLLFMCMGLAQAVETRFDAFYFFQSDSDLQDQGVRRDDLARFARRAESAVYKVMKKVKVKAATGYLVVAVRSDQEIASWVDMDPALHEYYSNAINDALQALPPFAVTRGIVVFAIKMSFDTPKFTQKPKPWPQDWEDADKSKLTNPDDIQELVLSVWPE